MDIEKAKQLLERLQNRTEARGATPAEAEASAMLAEKIIKRFGLQDHNTDFSVEYQLVERRMHTWIIILLHSMEKKFNIDVQYYKQIGKPIRLKFTGPEHLVRVARWLFLALYVDCRKRSWIAAKALGREGPKLTRFRLDFSMSAASMIGRRLNPISDAEKARLRAEIEEDCKKSSKSKQKQSLRELDWDGLKYGSEFGKQVAIDTNAVGQSQLKLEHQPC